MKKLINLRKYQKVLYQYDDIKEWNNEFEVMIKNGWQEGENYCSNNKYYQEYIKLIC